MTPAFRLLTACCGWPDDERRVDAVRNAAAEIDDWDEVVRLADRHRVEPLVVQGLRAATVEVPASLAMAAERFHAEGLRDLAESLRIAAALDDSGIEHCFLKGAPLGTVAYGTSTLKRSWDVDLLVAPGDAVAAAADLTALGYRPVMPPRALDAEEFARWSVVSKEAEFHSPRGATVELHWRLSDHPHLLRKVGLGDGSREVALLGHRSVRTLADAPNLAYLAVHGTAHAWFRLKWIADFNALVNSFDESERKQLLTAARHYGVGRALDTAVALAEHLFCDRPMPMTQAGAMAGLCLRALDAETERQVAVLASRVRWQIAAGWAFRREELRLRLRGTLDRIEHPLPARWRFLYPWLRIPFWIWRHRPKFWVSQG